jgi:hypothetical protein
MPDEPAIAASCTGIGAQAVISAAHPTQGLAPTHFATNDFTDTIACTHPEKALPPTPTPDRAPHPMKKPPEGGFSNIRAKQALGLPMHQKLC